MTSFDASRIARQTTMMGNSNTPHANAPSLQLEADITALHRATPAEAGPLLLRLLQSVELPLWAAMNGVQPAGTRECGVAFVYEGVEVVETPTRPTTPVVVSASVANESGGLYRARTSMAEVGSSGSTRSNTPTPTTTTYRSESSGLSRSNTLTPTPTLTSEDTRVDRGTGGMNLLRREGPEGSSHVSTHSNLLLFPSSIPASSSTGMGNYDMEAETETDLSAYLKGVAMVESLCGSGGGEDEDDREGVEGYFSTFGGSAAGAAGPSNGQE